jgi:hypothetical protein
MPVRQDWLKFSLFDGSRYKRSSGGIRVANADEWANKNQAYGNIYYYFYPDYGIVQIEAYNTPWGDQYFNLVRSHIIQ